MSFYRIYRPQVISDIDNERVRAQLSALLTKEKKDLPHAYLFSGPRGTGKTTAARIIAKLFNCSKPAKAGPCGSCEQCTSIANGRNIDVLELDAASNRGIDEIRALREGIGLAPASAPYKVYIIDEVHMLTTEAFNALLKTLEEPPRHAVFVLATTDVHKVPVTITSRCMRIAFARASQDEILSALRRIVKKEHIDISDDALALLSTSTEGSFRDAVKLLEQLSFHKGAITLDAARELLALATETSVTDFITTLVTRNTTKSLAIVEKVIADGVDARSFVVSALKELETMLVSIAKGSGEGNCIDLQEAIRRLSQAFVEMKSSPIVQLPLELAVIEYCERHGAPAPVAAEAIKRESTPDAPPSTQPAVDPRVKPEDDTKEGLMSLDKLTDCWPDVIAALKPYNHSVAGVMRATRPKSLKDGIVTIEAFYTFHKEKLSEGKTRDLLSDVFKKLFGAKVKVEVTLGKK